METITLGARLAALAHPLRIGLPVSALEICAKIRALAEQFEDELEQCASETVARPLRPGDVVRCLIGTALEHETRVTATEIRDGRHFVALDSNRGLGCTVPADTVRLVRHVDESGPLEDVHGPVAGDPPGVTVPASVTRAEFDALVSRLVDHSKRISDLAGRIHVIEEAESPPGQAFDELARRLDQRSARMDSMQERLDQLAEKVDRVIEGAEKGDLALAEGLDEMEERLAKLAAQLAEIKRPVDHLLDHFRVGGLRLRDHVAASAPDA